MPVLSLENRYSDKINRALNYAHANGDKQLQLANLADMACLSKFHFTRVFQDTIGESPVSFLRRIRLEKAASLIKHDNHLPILEVASRCGFSTPQLFSRVFGNKFGFAPGQFRDNHLNHLEDCRRAGYANPIQNNFNQICAETNSTITESQIDIVRLPPTRVAYVRSIGRYGGCGDISNAMDAVQSWAEQQELWSATSEIIGISWDYSSITPVGLCRYDACVPVPITFPRSSSVSFQSIPGGMYATAKIPYRDPSDLTKIWWWFSLMVKTSARFAGYNPSLSVGPWYEIYKSKGEVEFPIIELYVYLKPGDKIARIDN